MKCITGQDEKDSLLKPEIKIKISTILKLVYKYAETMCSNFGTMQI